MYSIWRKLQTVTLVGLKNLGATYERAMKTIFKDMIQKTIECYVNARDVKVKSVKIIYNTYVKSLKDYENTNFK